MIYSKDKMKELLGLNLLLVLLQIVMLCRLFIDMVCVMVCSVCVRCVCFVPVRVFSYDSSGPNFV